MKKLITAMLCLMPVMAFGTNVCIKNNSYFNIFKPSVDGTSSDSNNTTKVWKVVFPYRTITGKASCNAIAQIDGVNVAAKQVATNLYTGAEDVGSYCWCEMWPVESYYTGETNPETGPTSYWLFLKSYANDSACASACASDCASAVRYDTDGFRTAMFESMW